VVVNAGNWGDPNLEQNKLEVWDTKRKETPPKVLRTGVKIPLGHIEWDFPDFPNS
jgi:hypothetical protein